MIWNPQEKWKRGGPGTAGEDQWRGKKIEEGFKLPMPRPEKLKNATITDHFGFVVEENSVSEKNMIIVAY